MNKFLFTISMILMTAIVLTGCSYNDISVTDSPINDLKPSVSPSFTNGHETGLKTDIQTTIPTSSLPSEHTPMPAKTPTPTVAPQITATPQPSVLPNIQPKIYKTITYGKYGSNDSEVKERNSDITAYPLEIREIFGNGYFGKLVSFSGYVHSFKDGYFVLTETVIRNDEEHNNEIHAEDMNITAEYGWNISNGDYITIVGLDNGYWQCKCHLRQGYLDLEDVFLVES